MGIIKIILHWFKKPNVDIPISPMPPGWSHTISDLFDEMAQGKRRSVGDPEAAWAMEYERSLLPKDTRYPKKGDIYESLDDIVVNYMTSYSAPFTGSGDGLLKKGEKLCVCTGPVGDKPINVYLNPLNYKTVESKMIPETDRTDPKYQGYYLSIETMVLVTKFNLVEK